MNAEFLRLVQHLAGVVALFLVFLRSTYLSVFSVGGTLLFSFTLVNRQVVSLAVTQTVIVKVFVVVGPT